MRGVSPSRIQHLLLHTRLCVHCDLQGIWSEILAAADFRAIYLAIS